MPNSLQPLPSWLPQWLRPLVDGWFHMEQMPPSSAGFPKRGSWLIDQLVKMFNLTETQAAGVVGNLGFESMGLRAINEVNPLVPGSKGGFGWAQWTGPRRREFEDWAKAQGLAIETDEANFGFLVHELDTSYKHLLTKLRQTATLDGAVFVVGRYYEAPYGTTDTHLPGMEGRMRFARQALSQHQGIDVKRIVMDLQDALRHMGFYEGEVDGVPGPKTEKALRAWRSS